MEAAHFMERRRNEHRDDDSQENVGYLDVVRIGDDFGSIALERQRDAVDDVGQSGNRSNIHNPENRE